MAVNVNELKRMIVEKKTTQETVADAVGVDRSTFYRKMKNGGKFTVKEASDISKTLNLSEKEFMNIFFANTVA